jgi:hypothetical protein
MGTTLENEMQNKNHLVTISIIAAVAVKGSELKINEQTPHRNFSNISLQLSEPFMPSSGYVFGIT